MYKNIFFLLITFTLFNLNITYANPEATRRLETAIINNDFQMAQRAFRDGADLQDSRFHAGNNPLDMAISRNNISMVNLLLQHGAEVDVYIVGTGHNLITPLIKAIENQNLPIVTILLNARANVNMPAMRLSQQGFSPLMTAILAQPRSAFSNSNYAIFELLLAQGANVHYTTSDGFSSLMATTIGENSLRQQEIALIMARALLNRSVDPNLRDNIGRTALDYAKSRQFTRMVELLTPVTNK